jgi:hypothetical protein
MGDYGYLRHCASFQSHVDFTSPVEDAISGKAHIVHWELLLPFSPLTLPILRVQNMQEEIFAMK